VEAGRKGFGEPSTPGSRARKVSGWPNRCKLAHAFLWEYSYKRLKLAQLLGQLGVFLTKASGLAKQQKLDEKWQHDEKEVRQQKRVREEEEARR
jgi:hypothetical protein